MTQLFVDIETRRTANLEVIARLQAAVKPPSNYKKAETIQQWWMEEGKAQQLKAAESTALDGTYGRLASFAWAVNDDAVKCVSGDDEPGMLHAVAEVFNTKGFDLTVAFNGEFDFRFLYQRFVINKIRRPFLPGLNKGDYFFDPMREWAGFRGFIKQTDLEFALGISRDDALTGADVGTAIDVGDWASVEHHNITDVSNLREIYKRMTA